MLYDYQALLQVFVPFGCIMGGIALIYVVLCLRRKKSITESIKGDIVFMLEIASTLLVFVTLLEMQMERVQAYKPFLVLEPGTGACEYKLSDDEDEMQYAVFVHNLSNPELSGDVLIPIRNIGLGVANNLSMKFTIDFDANTKRYFVFEEEYPAFSIARYEGESIEVDRRYMRSNSFMNTTTPHANYEAHYQSFILPDNQEVLYVSIPVDYLAAVRHYFAYCHDIDVPPLYLEIEYEDIQGVHYSQDFYLSLSMSFRPTGTVYEHYTISYTFTPEKGEKIVFGGSAQDEFPEAYDYSIHQKTDDEASTDAEK